MADKVAVVTDSNKGIGFDTVRKLCKRGIGYVYLTATELEKGKEAVEKLNKEGFNPLFYELNVTDEYSVKKFAEHLKEKHGGLDILINNASVRTASLVDTTYEDSVRVLDINYFSLLTIQKYIFPILKDNARVINITSECGHISNLKNMYWVNRLTKEDITQEDIDEFVYWFFNSVKNGTLNEDDFEEMYILAYRISKIAVCALTRVQQRVVGRGISVNSLHPDSGGGSPKDEDSDSPVYLALDIDQSVKGKYFWFDKTEKDWADWNQKLFPCIKNLLIAKNIQI